MRIQKNASKSFLWKALSLGAAVFVAANPVSARDFLNRKPQATLQLKDSVHCVAFSPRTNLLAAGTENQLMLWDFSKNVAPIVLSKSIGESFAVLFSPDGKSLAVSGRQWKGRGPGYSENSIRLWDVPSRRLLWTRRSESYGIAFSPDGKRIATGSVNNRVKLWDAKSGLLLQTLQGQKNDHQIDSVAFSPDNRYIAGASSYDVYEDAGSGELLLWHLKSGQLRHVWRESSDVVGKPIFSSDGQKLFLTIAQPADTISVGGRIRVWNLHTKQLIRTLSSSKASDNLRDGVLSYDGRFFVTGSGGNVYSEPSSPGDISVWNTASGKILQHFVAHKDAIRETAFSFDEKWLASASDDGTIKVWKVSR